MDNFPKINPGERASIAGRTGSGKSTLARWLLLRSPGHWVILNPKHTKAYDKLPDSVTLKGIDYKKLEKAIREKRFVIINPTTSQATADYMDAFVQYMHESYTHIGLVVDEAYSLHKNGQAGNGLISWLTRGRELKQSYLGLTQRPAWVSKFLFSESDFIGGMTLALEEDRKRMYELTGRYEMRDKLPPREWFWYTLETDTLRKFNPVPTN